MTAIYEVPSALRQTAQAIRSTRGRALQLRRVFDRSLIPMAMVDSDLRYQEVNAAARLLSRMSLQEIREHRFGDFTPPEHLPALMRSWDEMLRRGTVSGRTFLTFKDGSGMWTLYAALANALPGLHLIVFVPADWSGDELEEMRPEDEDDVPAELSDRQLDVLRLVAVGANASQIADELSITEATVRTHVKNILGRLGAHNRAHAVALAIARGLLGATAFSANS